MFTAVACLSRSVRLHPCTRDSGGPGTLCPLGQGDACGIPGYGSI